MARLCVQVLHSVLDMTQYPSIFLNNSRNIYQYALISLSMFENVWILTWAWLNIVECRLNMSENVCISCSDLAIVLNMPHHCRYLTEFWQYLTRLQILQAILFISYAFYVLKERKSWKMFLTWMFSDSSKSGRE